MNSFVITFRPMKDQVPGHVFWEAHFPLPLYNRMGKDTTAATSAPVTVLETPCFPFFFSLMLPCLLLLRYQCFQVDRKGVVGLSFFLKRLDTFLVDWR